VASLTYDRKLTALLVIDPYSDFISEGGKVWDRIRGVAETNGCIPHTLQVLTAAKVHASFTLGSCTGLSECPG